MKRDEMEWNETLHNEMLVDKQLVIIDKGNYLVLRTVSSYLYNYKLTTPALRLSKRDEMEWNERK